MVEELEDDILEAFELDEYLTDGILTGGQTGTVAVCLEYKVKYIFRIPGGNRLSGPRKDFRGGITIRIRGQSRQ